MEKPCAVRVLASHHVNGSERSAAVRSRSQPLAAARCPGCAAASYLLLVGPFVAVELLVVDILHHGCGKGRLQRHALLLGRLAQHCRDLFEHIERGLAGEDGPPRQHLRCESVAGTGTGDSSSSNNNMGTRAKRTQTFIQSAVRYIRQHAQSTPRSSAHGLSNTARA
jgi:hypothetical protein